MTNRFGVKRIEFLMHGDRHVPVKTLSPELQGLVDRYYHAQCDLAQAVHELEVLQHAMVSLKSVINAKLTEELEQDDGSGEGSGED